MTEVANKINKNGNVPALRFPEFEGEWVEKKLGEVASIKSGSTPLRSNRLYFDEGDIPWVKTTDLNNSNIFDTEEKITHHANARINPVDTVLVAMYGGFNQIGRTGYLKVPAATNQALSAISPSNDYLQPAYLHIWLNAKVNLWKRIASSSRKDPNITGSDVAAFPVAMPSIIEQSKIASFLSLIDERISTQNKIIEELKTLKAALSKQIFSQKLRFKDVKGKDFPEWRNGFGNELFENSSNKKHSSDLPILAISQEHGAIPRDLIDYNITVTDKSIENYKVVDEGDFIISLRSFQGGIEFSNYKGICSPAYIILKPKVELNPIFYKYYFKTVEYIAKLNAKLEGIRDGKMISYKYFSEIELPIPSIMEQAKTASFLSAVGYRINIEEDALILLNSQKQFLLSKMFI